jgi:hypothetical protein
VGVNVIENEQDWPAGNGAGQTFDEGVKLPVIVGLKDGAAALALVIVMVFEALVVPAMVVDPKSRLEGEADSSGGAMAESGTESDVRPLSRAI